MLASMHELRRDKSTGSPARPVPGDCFGVTIRVCATSCSVGLVLPRLARPSRKQRTRPQSRARPQNTNKNHTFSSTIDVVPSPFRRMTIFKTKLLVYSSNNNPDNAFRLCTFLFKKPFAAPLHLSTRPTELDRAPLYSMKLSHLRWLAIGYSARAWHCSAPHQISPLSACATTSERGATTCHDDTWTARTGSRGRSRMTSTNAATSPYGASQGAIFPALQQYQAFGANSVPANSKMRRNITPS